MEKIVVSGVAADKNQARITIMGVPDTRGSMYFLQNSTERP